MRIRFWKCMGFHTGIYQLSKYHSVSHSLNEFKYFKITKTTMLSHLPGFEKRFGMCSSPRWSDVEVHFVTDQREFEQQNADVGLWCCLSRSQFWAEGPSYLLNLYLDEERPEHLWSFHNLVGGVSRAVARSLRSVCYKAGAARGSSPLGARLVAVPCLTVVSFFCCCLFFFFCPKIGFPDVPVAARKRPRGMLFYVFT